MTNMANVTIANLTSSWTDPTRDYTGLGLNITATSYDPSSKVFRLKVNGNTIFSVDASGTVSAPTIAIANVTVDIASPFDKANGAFNVANAAFGAANSEYTFTNAVYAAVNSTFVVLNAAFTQSNTDNVRLSASYVVVNSAFGSVNTVGGYANTAGSLANQAGVIANSAFGAANQAGVIANAAFSAANNVAPQISPAYAAANQAGVIANSAFGAANQAGTVANSIAAQAGVIANAAFGAANQAGTVANNANTYGNSTYVKKAGDTIAGDLVVQGNVTISGNTTYVNTQTLLIGDSLVTLNNDIPVSVAPSENAGLEIKRGSSANVALLWNEGSDKWTFTNDGTNYRLIASNTDVESANNYAGAMANSANAIATATFGTIVNVTASFGAANQAGVIANAGYVQANTARDRANDAYGLAQQLGSNASNSVVTNQTSYNTANAAFDKANNALANTSGVSFNGNLSFPTGNVSIGGSTSTARVLSLVSDISVYPTVGGATFAITSANTTTSSNTIMLFGAYDSTGVGRHGAAIQMGKDGAWTGGSGVYPGFMSFWTRESGGGNSEIERMRITSAGNVGIGTSSPAYTLDIAGSANISNPTLLVAGQNVIASFASGNNYAGAMANSANAWTQTIVDANLITARAYTNTSTTAANNYAAATFLPLAGGTLTGRVIQSASGFGVGTDDTIQNRIDSGFWQTSNAQTANGWPESTATWYHLLTSTHSNDANYYSMQFAGSFFDSNALYYRATNASGTTAWNKIWHAGNDGAGSGLDADTLDGLNSTAFYLASNPSGYVSSSGVTSITAGTGLSGGTITSTGTISLPSTGPGAGSYSSGISALTVDDQGRVTAITGSAGYITSSSLSSYLPLAGGTMTGLIIGRTSSGANTSVSSDGGALSVRGDATNAATISFHRPGLYAINMGLDTDNAFRIGGWSDGVNAYRLQLGVPGGTHTFTGSVSLDGTLSINSGYGSAAPAYAIRAWVSFNGNNGSIFGSQGVTSVTRNTNGDYTVNFNFTMPDANYAVSGCGMETNGLNSGGSFQSAISLGSSTSTTTTSCRLQNANVDGGNNVDGARITFMAAR